MATAASNHSQQFFHRQVLAKALADKALDRSIGLSGGLFLAAPRRTGKSTFVRQDLVPEFAGRGHSVVYVDLWSDKTVDPAIHIANAIRAKLLQAKGFVGKALESLSKAGQLSFEVLGSGMSFDLSQIGLSKQSTLSEAMKALSQTDSKLIILVIDEAQHALTSDDGINALFSLKAARDSLNTDAGMFGMQLVATGSNRDKLAALVNSRDQAFFGADMVNFPPLDKNYVQWALSRASTPFSIDAAFDAFKSLGYRPEPFRKAISDAQLHIAISPSDDPDSTLAETAVQINQAARSGFLNTVSSLPPLQGALLHEIAREEAKPPGTRKVGLFTAAMKVRLNDRLLQETGPDSAISVEASAVQSALDRLREQNFLWRSQRGSYTMEDEQCIDWLISDGEDEADSAGSRPRQR